MGASFLAAAAFLGALVASSLFPTRSEAGDVPRVLILGDSISLGYTPYVKQQLAGKADVLRPAENCAFSSNGLSRLDRWLSLGNGQWDVIHINWGIWDTHLMRNGAILSAEAEPAVLPDAEHGFVYDANGFVDADHTTYVRCVPEQYRCNLSKIVDRLKKTNARLVFATTTALVCRRPENQVLVDTYNRVATDLMKSRGVAINDLNQLVVTSGQSWYLPDGVHFTKEGYKNLATQVSEFIVAPEQSMLAGDRHFLPPRESIFDEVGLPYSRSLFFGSGRATEAAARRAEEVLIGKGKR